MSHQPTIAIVHAFALKNGTRRIAKHFMEACLLSVGAGRIARAAHRGRTIVLAWHNIVPAGAAPEGDSSLHLPQAAFAQQLDALRETHEIIALQDFDSPPRGDRPRAVLTFDDAYRGAVTVGIAEVSKRGLPATVFVAPGLFGTTPWWDDLAVPRDGAVPPSLRSLALTEHRGRSEQVLRALGPSTRVAPPWAEIATEAEVQGILKHPGISLGSHSWSHANLASLDANELETELRRPLEWLRGVGCQGTPWVSYPYGLTSPGVAAAARAAGYTGGFRIDGGWVAGNVQAGDRRFDLPRLNVPSGVSLAGFKLRAVGALSR